MLIPGHRGTCVAPLKDSQGIEPFLVLVRIAEIEG